MKRRAFIALVGGGVAWPLGAYAQSRATPVIGFLCSGTPETDALRLRDVWQGLNEAGYIERRNVAGEYRFAADDYDRLPALAADLVQRRIAVIVGVGTTPAALAAKAATTTIPVVFVVGADPVALGLVPNLYRPGSNLTGVTFLNRTIVAKQLQLLHEIVPAVNRIGFLVNKANPFAESDVNDARAAAVALAKDIRIMAIGPGDELPKAFARLVSENVAALLVAGDFSLNRRRQAIIELAARNRMPVIYPWREAALAGGLISYGTRSSDAFRLAGTYAGRILRGERAADLPVQQSTTIELVVNMRTAGALGIKVPTALLVSANEVIE